MRRAGTAGGRRHASAAPRGAGLVEVLVAAFVLSVGLLGIAGVHAAVLRGWNGLVLRQDAQLRLRALADSIDRGELAAHGERATPWGRARWQPDPPGVGLEAHAGEGDLVVARLWTGGPASVRP